MSRIAAVTWAAAILVVLSPGELSAQNGTRKTVLDGVWRFCCSPMTIRLVEANWHRMLEP